MHPEGVSEPCKQDNKITRSILIPLLDAPCTFLVFATPESVTLRKNVPVVRICRFDIDLGPYIIGCPFRQLTLITACAIIPSLEDGHTRELKAMHPPVAGGAEGAAAVLVD